MGVGIIDHRGQRRNRFFELKEADDPDGLNADGGINVLQRLERRLQRILAPQFLQRP
jgi:hypothetical protein